MSNIQFIGQILQSSHYKYVQRTNRMEAMNKKLNRDTLKDMEA